MAGADPLRGVGGVGFNVRGNLAEHVRELEMNADIAVFVNLDSFITPLVVDLLRDRTPFCRG